MSRCQFESFAGNRTCLRRAPYTVTVRIRFGGLFSDLTLQSCRRHFLSHLHQHRGVTRVGINP